MKTNINENPLKAYSQIPSEWGGVIGYQYATEQHYEDGWRDIVIPEFDHKTEKLGELYYDEGEDVGTYPVIEKTQQEIEAELISALETEKQSTINALLKIKILEESKEYTDEQALEYSSVYPYWSGDGEAVETGDKRNHLSTDGLEIWLWRCRQNHTTQTDWEPRNSPSLWERVEQDGEVLPYDPYRTYQIGELCSWEGKVYRCIMANTTWSPTGYPAAWEYVRDL